MVLGALCPKSSLALGTMMRAGYCRFEHAGQIRLSPCRPPGSLVPAGFQGKRGGVAAKKKDATQKKDAREDAPGVVAEHGGDGAEVSEDQVRVIERSAAIDVAKGSGMVCTRVPGSRPDRRRQQVWQVAAAYGEVTALMDHLRCEGIQRLVLETVEFPALGGDGVECRQRPADSGGPGGRQRDFDIEQRNRVEGADVMSRAAGGRHVRFPDSGSCLPPASLRRRARFSPCACSSAWRRAAVSSRWRRLRSVS